MDRHLDRLCAIARILIIGLVSVVCVFPTFALAQVISSPYWSQHATMLGYGNETIPPILIADQSGTVHAFATQVVGEDELHGAIIYSQWTLDNGWTHPNDVLLSPINREARILDVFLDNQGVFHLIFFGGDETNAQIYYAQAPVAQAHEAPAWSDLALVGEAANDPEGGALAGDDQGNLAIIYSGRQEGVGLYSLYSADRGETWTEPEPAFLTYDELFPFTLKLWSGRSGSIHMIWDARNKGGNGRQINYAQLDLEERRWSEQIRLAEVDTGYGVLFPAVAENDGEVIAAYSGISVRRSDDGGHTWTESVQPFHLTGINGDISFLTDSSGVLHLFWGQRISGNPDIHGMWHSVWLGGDRWSEPEPVVSGPRINDESGDSGFDPYDARAVVSLGNLVLVTWRSDPGDGIRPNGVWYSFGRVDAPDLSAVALPTVSATPTLGAKSTQTPFVPTPTQRPVSKLAEEDSDGAVGVVLSNSPALPVAIGVLPTIVLTILILAARSSSVFQNRQ